jgi:predicted peptidase
MLTPSLLRAPGTSSGSAPVYPAPRPPPTNPLFSTGPTRHAPASSGGGGEIDEAAAAAAAAPPTAGAVSGVLTAKDGLKYMVYLPKTWSAAPKSPRLHPLLLFLHGRGGVQNPENVRGQSITKMLLEGHPSLMAADAEGFPFIVLIPVASQPGWQAQFPGLLSLVASAQSDLYADPARTYLTGQSMGGNGAWHLAASAAAGVFTALVPVCGYMEMAPPPKKKKKTKKQQQSQSGAGDGPSEDSQQPPAIPAPDQQVVNALLQKSIPIWAFHSADDAVVPVGHTDAAIETLRQQQYEEKLLRYTRYETAPPMVLSGGNEMAGHAAWELAYATTELCTSATLQVSCLPAIARSFPRS